MILIAAILRSLKKVLVNCSNDKPGQPRTCAAVLSEQIRASNCDNFPPTSDNLEIKFNGILRWYERK